MTACISFSADLSPCHSLLSKGCRDSPLCSCRLELLLPFSYVALWFDTGQTEGKVYKDNGSLNVCKQHADEWATCMSACVPFGYFYLLSTSIMSERYLHWKGNWAKQWLSRPISVICQFAISLLIMFQYFWQYFLWYMKYFDAHAQHEDMSFFVLHPHLTNRPLWCYLWLKDLCVGL